MRTAFDVDRCGILIERRDAVQCSFGTDRWGRTTDERWHSFPLSPAWQQRFHPPEPPGPRWTLATQPQWEWDGERMTPRPEGPVAFVAIPGPTGTISAILCVDNAVSGRPLTTERLDELAAWCTCLGGVMAALPDWPSLRLRESLLHGVAQASRALIGTPEANRAVPEAMGFLGQATAVDRIALFACHPHDDGETLLATESHCWQADRPPRPYLPWHRRPLHPVLTSLYRRMQAGETWSAHREELPPVEQAFFASRGTRAMLAVPIRTDDRLWGFLTFESESSARQWTEHDRSALTALADGIGAALARDENDRQRRERERMLRGVASASQSLLATKHAGEGLRQALHMLGESAGVGRVYLFENVEVEGARFLQLADVWPASARPAAPVRRGYEEHLPGWYVGLSSGRSISGRVMDPLADGTGETPPLRSILLVPIAREGAFWGVLGVDHPDPGFAWDQGFESVLRTMASTLGGALARQRSEAALRASEDMLHHAQKMEAIGRLAGGVAHDFNNLLTAILGYAELTLPELADRRDLRENVEEIDKAAKRAHSLTRQLLAFSRRQRLEPRLVDLNRVVRDLEKMLRRLIGADIELASDLMAEPAPARVDPGQMEQVIINLVVNARDALTPGGRILLRTARLDVESLQVLPHARLDPGSYLCIEVQDNGCGMNDFVKAHLFEPFFTTKEQGRGTGLGLSTVYGIVEQSGGRLTVESEVGRGTTFRVFLPRVEEQPDREVALSPAAASTGMGSILLVEDEVAVRELSRRVLTGLGYDVIEATDGRHALERLQAHGRPVDLLLTDLVMPGMGGLDLAERIRDRGQAARILYMSGMATETGDDRIERLTPGNFLQKPFTPEDLALKVRDVFQAT